MLEYETPLTFSQICYMRFFFIPGGITSLIVGYPFDTIKVRIQTDDRNIYRGTLDCFKQMLFKEGPLSFFRGMSGLFVFATPRLALIFHGNSMGLNFIRGSDKEDAKIR